MIEKIIGKKKSLQRGLVKEFIILFIVIILLSVTVFYISVSNSIKIKLREVNKAESINETEIVNIVQRSIVISVVSTFFGIVLAMRYSAQKILGPIKQINEATKKIAIGDFNINLDCEREDEIGELTKNFNLMAKDLNKIEVLQKDFINNMSHEMKTPISSIKGFAQLLKKENLTEEEKQEYIDIIVEESDRLLHISSNILKLSKVQNKEKISKQEEIDIGKQINKVLLTLENKYLEKNIKIKTDFQKVVIYGDEDLLYQAWLNLIDNSIKFTKENGNIQINIKRKENLAIISIKDDGIGMTKEESRKIFERFYQVDESHYSQGSGLGLSIVSKIISLFDGKINVESEKGKGSNFIVELPIEKKKRK